MLLLEFPRRLRAPSPRHGTSFGYASPRLRISGPLSRHREALNKAEMRRQPVARARGRRLQWSIRLRPLPNASLILLSTMFMRILACLRLTAADALLARVSNLTLNVHHRVSSDTNKAGELSRVLCLLNLILPNMHEKAADSPTVQGKPTGQFLFCSSENQENVFLCQWSRCSFTDPDCPGILFSCGEQ